MKDKDRYKNIDLPFYKENIAPILPPTILDFHTHTWKPDHWKEIPWDTSQEGGKYMVSLDDYGLTRLASDGELMFPDRSYRAVCFGIPTPAAYLDKTNEYADQAYARKGYFPLYITGRNFDSPDALLKKIREHNFFGFKVLLNWHGDDYGRVKVEDMIGPAEMTVANQLGLIVLLHVPRSERLADSDVQRGVRWMSKEYPNARIVLAHCGRAYLPDEMKKAIGSIMDLENVFLDTSMVMDPLVLQMVFENIGPHRVLFGTDYPIAAMRGRRVYVMDHWVDIVLEGYPPSAFRVAADGIRATFMAWEIVLAVKRGAEMAGLNQEQLNGIFYGNGVALLRHVLDGDKMKKSGLSY